MFANAPQSGGIYIDPRNQSAIGPERATSVEWITPDGSPEFQIDAGIQMHGGGVSFSRA